MNAFTRPAAAGLLAVLACSAGAAEVRGVVGWAQRVELGTLVSGVIDKVHVRPGQTVAEGDQLISLDKRGFTSEVARWVAAQRHARAVLAEAEREDERAAELYDRTLLSDFERNQAAIALEGARARLQQAAAELVAARLDLERSVVRAPFDGLVLRVNAAPGQNLVSELQVQPLVTLANHRRLQVRAELTAEQAAAVEPGQRLGATLRGQALDAVVSYVAFEPVADGAAYELIAEIAPPAGVKARVGETVVLEID